MYGQPPFQNFRSNLMHCITCNISSSQGHVTCLGKIRPACNVNDISCLISPYKWAILHFLVACEHYKWDSKKNVPAYLQLQIMYPGSEFASMESSNFRFKVVQTEWSIPPLIIVYCCWHGQNLYLSFSIWTALCVVSKCNPSQDILINFISVYAFMCVILWIPNPKS